ncbi:MAG: 50S ribosomal protein L15 [Patescibacteria group bacterium]|jgi:large subunit ribosomal protein L15|nr:50S ribosomal protein L15 [Patescibacteria group bacterium]
MKLESLFGQINKKSKRVGRGIGSKKGKTAGRGTKGQLARTGKKLRPGFEGGQLPLVNRLPKLRGFKSRSPKTITISLDKFESYKDGTKISAEFLVKEGFIENIRTSYKIVAGNNFNKQLTFEIDKMSAGAKKQVENHKTKPTNL